MCNIIFWVAIGLEYADAFYGRGNAWSEKFDDARALAAASIRTMPLRSAWTTMLAGMSMMGFLTLRRRLRCAANGFIAMAVAMVAR